jgi:serine/threonine protein kinase
VAEDDNDPTSAHKRTDLERPFPASDSPAVPLRSGMVLAGRYEIGKVIGQGGMGLVVQAFDRTLGVEVAIKIVRSEYAGEREWSERLAREVKLARQIQHAQRLPRLRLRAGGWEGLPDHGAGHRWHAS